VPFDALQLIGLNPKHSTSSAIAAGTFFGVFMTIFQLTMGRSLVERRAERKAEASFHGS
jgi:hypothetical protein